MKKSVLLLVVMLVFGLSNTYGQTAIGLRGGVFGVDGNSFGGAEISVQGIGNYEIDLGWIDSKNGYSWKITGLKLFHLLGNREKFSMYAGAGVGLGTNHRIIKDDNVFHANLAADLGVSWRVVKFLQLTLDYRPEWNLTKSSTDTSFEWSNIALGVRYVLK